MKVHVNTMISLRHTSKYPLYYYIFYKCSILHGIYGIPNKFYLLKHLLEIVINKNNSIINY